MQCVIFTFVQNVDIRPPGAENVRDLLSRFVLENKATANLSPNARDDVLKLIVATRDAQAIEVNELE